MRPELRQDTRLVMQTIPSWLFCWQWIAAILHLGAMAASALPVIIALTLATGRRGHAGLSAYGARALAGFAVALAVLGPLLAAGEVFALLLSLRGAEHMFDGVSPWMPAMLPYTASVGAWLAGIACLLFYLAVDKTAAGARPPATQDCWQPGQIGPRVGLALLGLALARQMGSVVMQGFVLAYLFAYMVFYYYSLAVPFSLKSLYLVATGLGLLAVALVLRLWQTKQTGGEAGHA